MDVEVIEDVLKDFSSKLSTDDNDETQKYRISQYKAIDSSLDQSSRRNLYLLKQKSLRNQALDDRRGLLDIINAAEDDYHQEVYCPTVSMPGSTTKKKHLSNMLMLSEWMLEPPKDLETNWSIMACPKGLRVLLIASRGKTKIFNKKGKFQECWRSKLPGGSHESGEYKKNCILDCIWSASANCLYVLDVLLWVDVNFADCDAEFRHNWLNAKFIENSELGCISDNNQLPIYLLPKFNCERLILNEFLSHWPPFQNHETKIDGFLFYHKEANYVGGTTPLFIWLFPYMINELLGQDISVHENYNSMKPCSYTNQKDFIQHFNEEQAAKKKSLQRKYEKRPLTSNFQTQFESPKTDDDANNVMVFGEVNDVHTMFDTPSKKEGKKKRKKRNRNKAMDTFEQDPKEVEFNTSLNSKGNKSTEVDSALSSMDDSVLEESKIDILNDSGLRAME